MKERELRAAATCGFCREKIGHSGMPTFYRVRIERYFVNLGAVQRQTGLSMMLCDHAGLAAVMGADEEMATPVMDPLEFTVCETCSTDLENQSHCIARLAEVAP